LDRSPRRVKLGNPLLGLQASFDRSMILLQDVVPVLDRPVAATATQCSFLFSLLKSPGRRGFWVSPEGRQVRLSAVGLSPGGDVQSCLRTGWFRQIGSAPQENGVWG
jgi:hypothetical protein